MIRKLLNTDITNVSKNTNNIDIGKYPGVMDVSFENVGLTNVTIKTKTGSFTMAPGDPMMTWGGYRDYFRNDVLSVTFVGGTGSLNIYMNIHSNYGQC
jgi:hypothetical protein